MVSVVEEKPDTVQKISARVSIDFTLDQFRYDLPQALDEKFKLAWADSVQESVLTECQRQSQLRASAYFATQSLVSAFGELGATVAEKMFDAVGGAVAESFLEKLAVHLLKKATADALRGQKTDIVAFLAGELLSKVLGDQIIKRLPLGETGRKIADAVRDKAKDKVGDAIKDLVESKEVADYMKAQTRFVARLFEPGKVGGRPYVATAGIVDTIKGQAWLHLYVSEFKLNQNDQNSCGALVLAGDLTNSEGPALPRMKSKSFPKDTVLRVTIVQ
jgi:hypothetical protein